MPIFCMGIICPFLRLVFLLSYFVVRELERGLSVGLTVTESPERDVEQAGVSELWLCQSCPYLEELQMLRLPQMSSFQC